MQIVTLRGVDSGEKGWLSEGRVARAYIRAKTIAVDAELKAEGYDVGGRPSIQLSCYPGKGTSYGESYRPALLCHECIGITLVMPSKISWSQQLCGSISWYADVRILVRCSAARHADASGSAPDRTLTAIVYLNDGWDASAQGGKLCMYNITKSEASVAALHACLCLGGILHVVEAC